MKLLCIDFETANKERASVCAVGLAVIENNVVTDKKYWLVKPHPDYAYFDPFNIQIHGITPAQVSSSPSFATVYQEMQPLIEDSILVAHNAAFDISVLRAILGVYGIEPPTVDYLCTYKIARRTWNGLDNLRLNTICTHIGFTFQHHNAEEDAVACGKVLLAALHHHHIDTIDALLCVTGMQIGSLCANGHKPCSIVKPSRKSKRRT